MVSLPPLKRLVSAVLAALVVSAWYSNMDFGHLKRAMIDGGVQTAVVMLLVAASVVMGGFFNKGSDSSGFCALDPRHHK